VKDRSDCRLPSFQVHDPASTDKNSMSKKDTFRVVARAADGSLLIRDYPDSDPLLAAYQQIGIDDCSTDLLLRGLPVFRGLVGPMPEGKTVVRYETPEVFEMLTKEWGVNKPRRRSRARATAPDADPVRAAS
jgi:hypothetical protein